MELTNVAKLIERKWNPIPLPYGTISEPKGQNLDYVNVAHSHLIHCDWCKLINYSNLGGSKRIELSPLIV